MRNIWFEAKVRTRHASVACALSEGACVGGGGKLWGGGFIVNDNIALSGIGEAEMQISWRTSPPPSSPIFKISVRRRRIFVEEKNVIFDYNVQSLQLLPSYEQYRFLIFKAKGVFTKLEDISHNFLKIKNIRKNFLVI